VKSRTVRWPAVVGVATLALAVILLGRPWSARADSLATIDGASFDMSADQVDLDVEHGTALLQGNVAAKLGELEVRCPTVELRYDRSPRVSYAKGSGGVVAKLHGIDATAALIEFDAAARTVSLSGAVRLSRGKGWVTAEHATVDIATNKVTLQEVKGSIPLDPSRR
jgi:lipopolysaccharide export system protein LptA